MLKGLNIKKFLFISGESENKNNQSNHIDNLF